MGGTGVHRSARGFRRARRLRSERRGVVAVIGTLLALLVFFALFGIFLTQYVPFWMTENEATFTSQAASSFAQFKSDVDSQYVLGAPPVLGAPFTISSQGIPLIAQPTQGILNFLPQTCPGGFYAPGVSGASPSNYGQPVNPLFCIFENQTIKPAFGGHNGLSFEIPTGILEMILPNRYYSSQTFIYEADGVIQLQAGGFQIMAYAPPLNVTRLAGNTTVTSSFLELFGNATTVAGQGSEEVYSHLKFAQPLSYNGWNTTSHVFRAFNYSFEIGTEFPCAWSNFLWHQVNVSSVPSAQYSFSPFTKGCNNPAGFTSDLWLNLTAVNYVSLYYAGTQVSVGIGSS